MREFFTLVPYSGLQFVSWEFDLQATERFSKTFYERREVSSQKDQMELATLHPSWNKVDPEGDPIASQANDLEITISKQKAMEPFLDKWIPVPYLRFIGTATDGAEHYDRGPTNWVRAKISLKSKTARQEIYSVVFVFDTEVFERPENRPYTAPTPSDAITSQEFRFVSDMHVNSWFVSNPETDLISGEIYDRQAWVLQWLRDLFREMKEQQRPGRPFIEDEHEFRLEYAARYFAFLDFLKLAVDPVPVRFIDTVSDAPPSRPVGVDLILDIGNSRTCGLLIERFPNEQDVKLSNSMVLELRDLEQPDRVYSKPFESHVELVAVNFGREDLSRESGRSKAFFWPGIVRVGPEAARYREQSDGTQAISGMSSPKRYLWDVNASNQDWKYNAALARSTQISSPIEKAMLRFTNKSGDVLSQVRTDLKFFKNRLITPRDTAEVDKTSNRTTYSRSSFFTFMVAEIVCQAIAMVNNPQVRSKRGQKDLPRQIERIFFTLPTAMPIREQQIMKMRAEGAIRLIWDLMGWNEAGLRKLMPKVFLNIDEASCVQFVYLYSEIARKFGGNMSQYFNLMGKPRQQSDVGSKPAANAQLEPSLRIASIDIGGGTTDLMITTYFSQADRALLPVQVFREGFRVAGDDILRAVIENHVIPNIERNLTASGMRDAREFLKEKFEVDRSGLAEQEKHLRRQFVLRVLCPIGLAILRAYEKSSLNERYGTRTFTLLDLLEHGEQTASLGTRVTNYIEDEARRRGANGFDFKTCSFDLNFIKIAATADSVLKVPLELFSEVIHHFDCDIVLLTGRPTCLPCVKDYVQNLFPVSPDKVVALHAYQPGAWYPFAGRGDGRIADPKTTASVGAMLCALAEYQLTNFKLQTAGLRMRSTADFLGDLEQDGKLRNDRVIFKNDTAIRPGEVAEKSIAFYGKVRIGYRQMPYERWAATPLYMLKLEPGNYENVRYPIEVVLEREMPDELESDSKNFLDRYQAAEAQKEEIRIREATDSLGNVLTKSVSLSLNTLMDEGGYWLDTGVLRVP